MNLHAAVAERLVIRIAEQEHLDPDAVPACPQCRSTEWFRTTSGSFTRTDRLRTRADGTWPRASTEDQEDDETDWDAWACEYSHIARDQIQNIIEDLFSRHV